METQDPLAHIAFISLGKQGITQIGDFTIDPHINLPVELSPNQEAWSKEDISWESIIAAMLKLLIYAPDHQHIDYYRQFVLAVKPQIGDELLQAGILKARNRDFDLAIEIFSALEGLFPDNPRIKLNLALVYEDRAGCYRQQEDSQSAEEYTERAFAAYKRALTAGPEVSEIHFNLAHFYLKQKSFAKAKEHFGKFRRIGGDPQRLKEAEKVVREINSWGTMDQLFKGAFDCISMGKEEEGITKIKRFLDEYPQVWNAWFLLGWGHRRLAHYQEGKEAFQQALSLNRRHSDTLNELAICQMELGELDACYQSLTKALRLDPDNTKIISNLGILALKRGNPREAISFFKSVLAKDQGDTIAFKYLQMLE